MPKAKTAPKKKPAKAAKKKPAATSKTKQSTIWESRIVATGEEDPEQLLANPDNWRIHPTEQRAALAGVLDRIGWIQNIVINRTTGRVVDGHLRTDLAVQRGEKMVPVLYVELSEEEEKIALAALDPITGMAIPDSEKLAALMADLDFSDNENLAAEVGSLIALKSGGRGVASLVSTRREMTVQHLAVDRLVGNTFSIKAMTEVEQSRLRQSMKNLGLIQAVLVRPIAGGKFEVIDGLQRWAAARELKWTTIACRVKEMSDTDARITALAANKISGKITSDQMTKAVDAIRESVSDEEIHKKTGMSRAAADQYGGINDFPVAKTPEGVPVRQYKVEQPEDLDRVDIPKTLMIPLGGGEYLEARETLDTISADWSEALMIVVRAWKTANG